MEVEAVSCECCGLEEECTGEYIGGVRAYFGGRWLCGLCSEAVKYEAGKCARGAGAAAPDVEEAVRAHMAICRTLKSRGRPAGRVADGMCQMLRTASWKKAASSSSAAASPRGPPGHQPTTAPPPRLCPSASDAVIAGAAGRGRGGAACASRSFLLDNLLRVLGHWYRRS